VEKHPEDFFHGLSAGRGKTACGIAGMRSRKRSFRENRRFSSVEKRLEDFFHGLRERVRLFPRLASTIGQHTTTPQGRES
jgi:hypothetical protein